MLHRAGCIVYAQFKALRELSPLPGAKENAENPSKIGQETGNWILSNSLVPDWHLLQQCYINNFPPLEHPLLLILINVLLGVPSSIWFSFKSLMQYLELCWQTHSQAKSHRLFKFVWPGQHTSITSWAQLCW